MKVYVYLRMWNDRSLRSSSSEANLVVRMPGAERAKTFLRARENIRTTTNSRGGGVKSIYEVKK